MLHHMLRAAAGRIGIPTSGLVAHYTGDDLSGTTLLDKTGNSDLSLINGPSQVAGYDGQAITYDGANDYGQAPISESFSGGITIARRIRINQANRTNVIFSKRDSGSLFDIQEFVNNSNKLVVLYDGLNNNESSHTQTLSSGVWYYIEASYNGSSQVKIRINDSIETFSRTGAIDNTVSNFRIASDWFSSYGSITVDDFLIYNRALDSDESDLVRSLI